MTLLPAVVLAGGLGTRIAAVTGGVIPKVMVPIDGRPFIDYKLGALAAQGVSEVILLVAHQGDLIREHLGDRPFGLSVTYAEDGPRLLGTGGALRQAVDVLPDAFFLTYGDSFLPVELAPLQASFLDRGLVALMTVNRNHDRWGASNVEISDDRVTAYHKAPPSGLCDYIDYGLLLMRRSAVEVLPAGGAFDLGDLFARLIAEDALAAYEVEDRFYEVGTPERLEATARYLRSLEVS